MISTLLMPVNIVRTQFLEVNQSAAKQLEASLSLGLKAKVHAARAASHVFRYPAGGKGAVFRDFSVRERPQPVAAL